MTRLPKIDIKDYNYDLPEERIAQYPVQERDRSKLLLYNKGSISADTFTNIANHLPSDSLLVFNNTKVIRARLLFKKLTGAAIEILCLEPLLPADYEQSFSSVNPVEWKCIIGNLKKWKSGSLTSGFLFNGKLHELKAEKVKSEGEAWRIRFSWENEGIAFSEVTEAAGHIPLPPYVKREDEAGDNIRYQTVYSRIRGSVAAPTAGLHFTNDVLTSINNKGIKTVELTLHIGAGTFKPVKTNDISKHEMHCEHFFVTSELVETLLSFRGRTIAIGTTSVRTLESLYWLGVRLINNPDGCSELNVGQWDPYYEKNDIPLQDSFEALLKCTKKRGTGFIHGSTTLMIVPGYRFRVISGMVTNFHQPGSSLLLMVSAFTGDDWKKIYCHALTNGFRFLSFGDTSLLIR
ncbi:MAG: S-adenosylmethionine:tRNA ribosyltransferase-isomerase [Bacteroidia bacterium]|nr:S-adenosylmethionine:tRNA ribosyltransferase-isomerase [Bacteroidia bacterium]